MSAHHDHEEENSSLGKLIGFAFLIAFMFGLIAMMGIVGFAFLGGRPTPQGLAKKADNVAKATEAAPAASVAAAAPAPAKQAAPAKSNAAKSDAPAAKESAAPAAGAAPSAEQMALGQTSYAMCAACHAPDGKGLKAGPALMAPSLVGSEVLLGDPDASLLIVLNGIAKEDMKYMGQMMGLAAGLDDEKLAAVLTFVRNSWGNSAPAITTEQAAAARKKFSGVSGAVKRDEIMKVVEKHK